MLGDFTLVDVLDRDMKCFQLENGTIFRFKKSEPQQLLYKENDNFSSTIISVLLPDGKIEHMTASHNRLYFNTDDRKVYCVEKYQLCAVYFLRDLNETETVGAGAVSSYSDLQGIHRLENNQCARIVLPKSELAHGGTLQAIHRCKAIFTREETYRSLGVEIEALNHNSILLSLPLDSGEIFCDNSSAYIYAPAQSSIYVLNTDSMEPLQTLNESSLSNISIVGVRGDVVTLTADIDGDRFLIMARLPEGYFDSSVWSVPPAIPNGSNDNTTKLALKNSAITRDRNEELKINKEVNDLLDKNAELVQQIEKLKNESKRDRFQEEMLKSFTENTKKLIRENEQLEENNRDINQSLARAAALNEEYNASNDQLSEELEIIQEEEEKEQDKFKELQTKYRSFFEEKLKLTAAALDKKRQNMERLEKIISENRKLCNSLSSRSNDGRIHDSVGARKLIAENEQILKLTAISK